MLDAQIAVQLQREGRANEAKERCLAVLTTSTPVALDLRLVCALLYSKVETNVAEAVSMLEGVRQRAGREARALYLMVLERLCSLLLRVRRFSEATVVAMEMEQLDRLYPIADLNVAEMWAVFDHFPCSLTLCKLGSSGSSNRVRTTKQFYLRGIQLMQQPLVLIDAATDAADPIEPAAITAPPLRFEAKDRDVKYFSLAALWFGWCDATSLRQADVGTMYALAVSKLAAGKPSFGDRNSQVRNFGYFSAVPMWSGADNIGTHRLVSMPLSVEKAEGGQLLIELSQVENEREIFLVFSFHFFFHRLRLFLCPNVLETMLSIIFCRAIESSGSQLLER